MSPKVLTVSIVLFAEIFFSGSGQETASRPIVLQAIPPIYPVIAASTMTEGKVIVEVKIGERGQALSATVIEGPNLLRKIAEIAAMRWLFAKEAGAENAPRVARIIFDFKMMPENASENDLQPIFKPPYEIEVRGVKPKLVSTPIIDPPVTKNKKYKKKEK
jgi:hypothetical protein